MTSLMTFLMTSLMTSLTTSLLIRYEPQVFQTAQALLSRYRVPALQLELTRTPSQKEQTCAAIKMLEHLHALGYDFRQVPNALVDAPAPVRARMRGVCAPGGRGQISWEDRREIERPVHIPVVAGGADQVERCARRHRKRACQLE
jgi:hypothetical protein